MKDEASITAAGALVRARVLEGELWRIVNAMFLHADPGHLIGNCLCLYVLGIACEHAVGLGGMLVLYSVSGISGAVASMAMQPGPSVGASGAIFGIAGAVIVFLYMHQDRYRVRDKRIGFVLAFWALYQIACGFLSPLVDNYAHIGGFLAGAATMRVMSGCRRRGVIDAV